jgi:hypothetical protein
MVSYRFGPRRDGDAAVGEWLHGRLRAFRLARARYAARLERDVQDHGARRGDFQERWELSYTSPPADERLS